MADIKISELSQAESLSLSDLMESAIPYNGGFQSRRMTIAQLSNYLENSVLHNALDTTTKNIIGAINEILHDLANYYTTSQTYSKTEVDTLIAGVSGLHFEVVNALPTQDIDMNTIYLVPKQDSGQQDVYDEFICLDDTTTPATWEKIGTTEIDLSDYVTDTELATELLNYVTTSALNTALQSYATTSAMTTALADKVDKVQGKGLSTEDYTTVEKAKLNGIESGAQVNDHKVAFENVSSNPPLRAVILIKDADDISGNSYPQFDAGSLFYYPTISEWRLGNIDFRGKEELDIGGTGEFMYINCRNNARWKSYKLLVDMNISDSNDVNIKFPSSSGQLALQSDIPTDFAVSRELMTEDLNDVKTVGFYVGKSGNTCANKPSSDFRQFGLYVIRTATSGTGNYYKQILIRPNAQGETWSRNCVNGTWSAWAKDIDNSDIVDVVRWSEQNLLGAKNIIPYPYRDMTTTKNGITFTVNADYSVTVGSGSPSANTNWYYCYRETVKSGKYILSGFADTNQGTNFCLRAVINQDLSGSRTYNDYGEGVEVTVNDGEVLSIYLHMSASGVSNNKNHYAMIRPSTVADATYQEPTLTNGQLTLNKLSWEENKASGVKNYFQYPFYPHALQGSPRTNRGVTFTDIGNGKISANGTNDNTGNSYCQLMNTITGAFRFVKLPAGRYHFSGGISADYYLNLSTGLETSPTSRTEIGTDYGEGFDFEVTETQAENNIFCSFAFVKQGKTANNVVFYPMIARLEDSSQGYAEYAMTNIELTQLKADMNNIATTETSGVSANTYAIGDYMFWRGGFYRVTQAIAVGDSITTSKVTKTTIGAELKRALT